METQIQNEIETILIWVNYFDLKLFQIKSFPNLSSKPKTMDDLLDGIVLVEALSQM